MFELLFSHMALHLFIEPEQAIDILKVYRTQVEFLRLCSKFLLYLTCAILWLIRYVNKRP